MRSMACVQAKIFRALSIIYAILFSASISIISFVSINGIVGFGVFICHVLKLSYFNVIRLKSAILRMWFSIFTGHFEHFSGLTIVLSGDAFRPDEPALVICNHRSWIDSAVIFSLARQVGMHGDVKFLGKQSLLLFPVFGIAAWLLNAVVFIKRQSSSAGRRMTRVFSNLTDERRQGKSYWLVNYLEGTRFTPEKRREAVEFAKKRDLKVLDQVLQPRTKGFVATVSALRGNAKAVYDITIGYNQSENEEMDPSFQEMYFIGSSTNRLIYVHQKRIPLSSVPEDEEALKDWIYALYEQKDELLRGFREKGKFEGRPMRWNRIQWAYLSQCILCICGPFFLFMYCLFTYGKVS